MALWLLDHLAHWSEQVGDWLSRPFFRVSRWATERWFASVHASAYRATDTEGEDPA